jgi:N-acetylglucosaminyl-diphospho-decaprenol L-rhamnosyltransferase
MAVELSYCVVNTEQRQLLSYCLDAIARERATVDFETETLVLDNASTDGSADTARAHAVTTDVIALERRRHRAQNATALLEPGATAALHDALAATDDAAAAGATLVTPGGHRQASAWRFPSTWTHAVSMLGLGPRFLVQSHGRTVRDVDWAPAAALLVRREAAAAVGWLQEDEIEFCRRLRAAGWRVLYAPEARAVHHDHR